MLVSHILEHKGGDVVTTTPGTSLIRVAQLFVTAHIGAAVVVDDGGTIVGLVSERDMAHHIARAEDDALDATAGDIMATADFEIVNPEHHLATLDSAEARLSVEFNVEQGVGYEPASHEEGLPIGLLPVDAIYTPVRKANYLLEYYSRR